MSEEEIIEVCKDKCFTKWTEEDSANATCNFHGFKDDSFVITNKGKKNQRQRDIVNINDSTIQLREDGIKRVAVSLEEASFLVQKTSEGEHHYPYLK